jgi:hypothetical protein
VAGCSSTKPDKQKVVFHYSFLKTVWGYENYGWIIDNTGNVKKYNITDKDDRISKDGYLSKDGMDKLYNISKDLSYKVSSNELIKNTNLLKKASKGKVDINSCCGNDSGTGSFYGYVWDDKVKKYKQIIISQSGDISSENISSEGKEIDKWLKMVNKTLKK